MTKERAAEGTADSTAEAFFRTKLRFEIDVMDVADAPDGALVLVDTRRKSSWDHGHIPGALHIPTADIPSLAPELVPFGMSVVVYSRARLQRQHSRRPGLRQDGLSRARELIGGIEYWIRKGLPVETPHGVGQPTRMAWLQRTRGNGPQPELALLALCNNAACSRSKQKCIGCLGGPIKSAVSHYAACQLSQFTLGVASC